MNLVARLRRGEGPLWGGLKQLAKAVLHFHVPVAGPSRWLFRGLYGLHVGIREGLGWLARFAWYEPLFRSQCEAVGPGFRLERLPYLVGSGRIRLGKNVEFAGKIDIGFSNRHHADPEFTVGDDTFLGHACVFNIARSIRIGNHCLIAGDVRIADFDGHPVDAARRRAKETTPAAAIHPVVLEDDVWVGRNVLILKGVTIGARSIIGAGAVVAKDVPPDVVAAGNPARIVKYLSEPTNGAAGRVQRTPASTAPAAFHAPYKPAEIS